MTDTGARTSGPDPSRAPSTAAPLARERGRAWGEGVGVLLLLTAVAIVLTWPATARLGSAVIDLGDPLLTTWILAWDVHALRTAPFRFFDANMFHPHRWALAYTEHLLGLVPLVGLARLAGAGVLLAHNLVWLATFPLTGLAMFWLVRHLTGQAGAAAIAALLYAFAPFRIGQLGHVQILSHQWLPLMLLGLHRAAESRGRWRDVGLAAGAFTLQALSSGYHAFFAAIAGAVFLAWLGLPSTRPPLARLIGRGLIAGAVVAVLLLPLVVAYRLAREEIGLARSVIEVQHYVATPWSYLAAPAESRWFGAATARFRAREAALFPGLLTLALAGAGVLFAGRASPDPPGTEPGGSRRWPRWLDIAVAVALVMTAVNWLLIGGFVFRLGPIRLSQRQFSAPLLALVLVLAVRRLVQGRPQPIRGLAWLGRLGWPNPVGLYAALTAVGVIASLGPEVEVGSTLRLLPLYAQLCLQVPGFAALRVPGRFGILVTTGLAGLAGLGAAALARRLGRPRWRTVALGALGVVAVLEAWTTPLQLVSVSPEPGPAGAWLAAQPGTDAVLVLPMYAPNTAHLESLRLLASTAHWRPLVNGYAGVFPASYAKDVATLNTFPAPAAVARLRTLYVRYVVVNLGQYPDEERARVTAALEAPPRGVARVAAFPDSQIFEIGASAPSASGDAGGADEIAGALEHVRIREAGGLERVKAGGDREDRVEAVAFLGEPLAGALLPIDQDHEILDHQARGLERRDRLELRRPVGDDVVDHHDPLSRLERALDPPAGAVSLVLAPRIDERDAAGQARRDGERQAGVRDAGDAVDPAAGDRSRDQPAHLGQHLGMRDHDAQIDVERRGHARLQDELAEAHAPDLVEASDERAGVESAHAGSSARMAAAAPAGSAAPVIGRPTTR